MTVWRACAAVLALVGLLSACDSGASPTAAPTTTTGATTTTPQLVCELNREDCTAAEVIATVRRIFEVAGLRNRDPPRRVAACIASAEGRDAHSVHEAMVADNAPAAARCKQYAADARMAAEFAYYFTNSPHGTKRGTRYCIPYLTTDDSGAPEECPR
jgi:hypothetical protein